MDPNHSWTSDTMPHIGWLSDEFPRDYDARVPSEKPAGLKHFTRAEAIYVEGVGNNFEWTLPFAVGHPGCGVTGLVSTPNPKSLLVLCCGAAYLVPVGDPASQVSLHNGPLFEQVFASRQFQCVLLADCTGVTCIGPQGYQWTSPSLVLDDLQLLALEGPELSYCGSSFSGPHLKTQGILRLDEMMNA